MCCAFGTSSPRQRRAQGCSVWPHTCPGDTTVTQHARYPRIHVTGERRRNARDQLDIEKDRVPGGNPSALIRATASAASRCLRGRQKRRRADDRLPRLVRRTCACAIWEILLADVDRRHTPAHPCARRTCQRTSSRGGTAPRDNCRPSSTATPDGPTPASPNHPDRCRVESGGYASAAVCARNDDRGDPTQSMLMQSATSRRDAFARAVAA